MPKKPAPARDRTEKAPTNQPRSINASQSCSIVGIGASAGGLEAFTEILKHMPPDPGMALVLIQHLDPHHESVLTELLSRATNLRVVEAREGTAAEPNNVYVIRPNSSLTVSHGVLRVARRAPFGQQMPIDTFFRSLAEEESSKAIGVILSGTASDGTLGLKAIKAEGGITFAQDPESAKYDGMPRSAVAAGCVDFVLPPPDIAKELVRLCRHPYVAESRSKTDTTFKPDYDFSEIFSLLRSGTGVDFTYYKHATLQRRILRRMALNRVETIPDYVTYIRQNRGELQSLFQDILINVTGFFRESAMFDFLDAKVFPELFKGRAADDPVRVWVPGCSTGEEAYSVGICLLEYMREHSLDFPLQIFGTDLSETALERARAGIYPEAIAAEITPERLRRFFTKVNNNYKIASAVRDVCVFARQNLTKDPPFSKLDLITCRNVLIYLGPVLQQKLMSVFHYALKPSGYLALGLSETAGQAPELFTLIDRKQRVYTRNSVPSTVNLNLGTYHEPPPPVVHMSGPESAGSGEIQRKVDQLLLSRYSPPGVVVDDDLKIIQFRGRTSPFLEHTAGEANLNLIKMSKGGLGMEIRKLVQRAKARSGLVQSDILQVGAGKSLKDVRISVTPLITASGGTPHFVILFEETPPAPAQKKGALKAASAPPGSARRLRELEKELGATKLYLQSVIEDQEATTEELKSANEEIQSSNEELQSTNEELLTAKEELQSANEELTTVNEEMQGRNSELIQTNNDLNNLLSSANIPIVMLGNDLRIRRFTPQAEKLLNILPTDVGRPFSDFRPKINVADLEQIFTDVIDKLNVQEREVQDKDGHYYSMWVRPYRTTDNKIDGVVMSLFDITGRKTLTEARYRRLFEAARDGILIVDPHTGEVVDSNPFIAALLGYSRAELTGRKFWELGTFSNKDLRGISNLEVDGDDWRCRVTLTTQAGKKQEVELLANVYQEGERRVLQLNIRDLTSRAEYNGASADGGPDSKNPQTIARVAGTMGRDLNNPITSILGFAERLEKQLGPQHPAVPEVKHIRDAGEQAAALTRKLLAFGRHQKQRVETLDLNNVVLDLEHVIRAMIPSNVHLGMQAATEPVTIRNDKFQTQQIILELVAGACDVLPKGGSIALDTSSVTVDEAFSKEHPAVPPGDYAVVHVRSIGQQISSEKLFGDTQSFARDTTLGFEGLQSAVRASGAHLWSYSELGKGRSASVYFPRLAAQRTGKRSSRELPRGKETILVVEPDDSIRDLVANSLRESGYNVLSMTPPLTPAALTAAQGESAVELVIAEASTRNGDGLGEQKLREMFPKVKLLYVFGGTDRALAESGVDGASPVLQKPFTPGELARAVREALDQTH